MVQFARLGLGNCDYFTRCDMLQFVCLLVQLLVHVFVSQEAKLWYMFLGHGSHARYLS